MINYQNPLLHLGSTIVDSKSATISDDQPIRDRSLCAFALPNLPNPTNSLDPTTTSNPHNFIQPTDAPSHLHAHALPHLREQRQQRHEQQQQQQQQQQRLRGLGRLRRMLFRLLHLHLLGVTVVQLQRWVIGRFYLGAIYFRGDLF